MDNQLASLKIKKHLAKVLFLIVPTWLVCFFILWQTGKYFSVIMESQYLMQSIFIGLGMLGSALFYAFRFRFVTTFSVLVIGLYLIYWSIDKFSYGEFDAYFFSVQFFVFSIMFSLGWFLSWGFIRKEKFPIIISVLFFVISIFLIAKQKDITVNSLLQAFVPLILFILYIFYAVQLIAQNKDLSQSFWAYLLRRLGLFILFSFLIIGIVLWSLRSEIIAKVSEFGSGVQAKESMLKKNKDGSFSLKDYTKLSGNLGRDNQLLFVAKINNFFEDGQPNPLYLTSFYYSKYDTASETFEPDSLIPQNDLFRPNPSKIGLYFTETDSSVLKQALKDKFTKVIDIEVYKTILSPNEFVAPITSYFIQPITVDQNNKEQYKSAYRAKSLVSELNSAYFVYNPGSVQALKQFQEMRYEQLRTANDFSGISKEFIDYYTSVPENERFEEIANLAKETTKGASNNLDKVVAIRDYFLSKDENGKPLFKYSDNPGVPDIPSASKLNYFLFENRKGYCAYYAGATLFMLRSLGIPSRIAAGFLTQDRNSGHNKGWYWFYADQAHAWVQVYFPGYGWLDFDTTVGNDEAQKAPQPDGTPPNTPGNAIWAVEGLITEVDTIQKFAKIKTSKFIFKDKLYVLSELETINMDLSVASIGKDSINIPIAQLKIGDSATAISFAEAFKKVQIVNSESSKNLLQSFPKPAPVDELQIKKNIKDEISSKVKAEENTNVFSWKKWLTIIGIIMVILLILFVCLSFIYKIYLNFRAKYSKTFPEKAYWNFTFVQFYLHQMGFERIQNTAWDFAKEIDGKLPLNYNQYIQYYLKLKYANEALKPEEQDILQQFKPHFIKIVNQTIPAKKRMMRMFNPIRTLGFLSTKNH
ncbi:MAG TPA: transglutaminase-like domain-containing protein [Edaphocola sp.]|nr:transglutaminase-like domain-containing protein [Edaphocola sp.]